MKMILVTGGNGQLAHCIEDISGETKDMNLVFADVDELDIANKESVKDYFSKNNFDYCINCAAYTAVDKAETEKEKATLINVTGAKNLASACNEFKTILIHISTDFVFDGKSSNPYVESDTPNPVSIYGRTKLEGELTIQESLESYFILRTSWLYSEYGNNFMKTMLRLGNEHSELGVVNDQFGTPTYAKDLAKIILKIIESNSTNYGVLHYSNDGVISWYDFAKAIFEIEGINIDLNRIPTTSYPTPAKRPKYSVLDTSKIKEMLKVDIPAWKDSLKQALIAYHSL